MRGGGIGIGSTGSGRIVIMGSGVLDIVGIGSVAMISKIMGVRVDNGIVVFSFGVVLGGGNICGQYPGCM